MNSDDMSKMAVHHSLHMSRVLRDHHHVLLRVYGARSDLCERRDTRLPGEQRLRRDSQAARGLRVGIRWSVKLELQALSRRALLIQQESPGAVPYCGGNIRTVEQQRVHREPRLPRRIACTQLLESNTEVGCSWRSVDHACYVELHLVLQGEVVGDQVVQSSANLREATEQS